MSRVRRHSFAVAPKRTNHIPTRNHLRTTSTRRQPSTRRPRRTRTIRPHLHPHRHQHRTDVAHHTRPHRARQPQHRVPTHPRRHPPHLPHPPQRRTPRQLAATTAPPRQGGWGAPRLAPPRPLPRSSENIPPSAGILRPSGGRVWVSGVVPPACVGRSLGRACRVGGLALLGSGAGFARLWWPVGGSCAGCPSPSPLPPPVVGAKGRGRGRGRHTRHTRHIAGQGAPQGMEQARHTRSVWRACGAPVAGLWRPCGAPCGGCLVGVHGRDHVLSVDAAVGVGADPPLAGLDAQLS